MKYPNTGLYHYCLNLGTYVRQVLENENKDEILFYVPAKEAHAFPDEKSRIVERRLGLRHFHPFLWKCDVWHAPFQSGRLIPRPHRRIRILLTIHDLNVLHEDKPQKEKTESLRKTQQLINASDAVVCISNHTKNDVLANLNVGNTPLHVIYNGTHQVNRGNVQAPVYKPDRPFIFTIGYVNRKKNFHTLLALLRNPGIELVIAGKLDEPDYVSSMINQAKASGVADRLKILGPVSEEDKAWYFENCMAFALPSLAEGFGAPVVEAMSFGKPVFLSSKTSLPEIGGNAAFYFSDFNPGHMLEVFEKGLEKYEKEKMCDMIKQRCTNFNWEEKAREYIQVYRSMLQK